MPVETSKRQPSLSDIWKSLAVGVILSSSVAIAAHLCGALPQNDLVIILVGLPVIITVGHAFVLLRIYKDARKARRTGCHGQVNKIEDSEGGNRSHSKF